MTWDKAEKQRRIKTGSYLIEEREDSQEIKGRDRRDNKRGTDPVLILYHTSVVNENVYNKVIYTIFRERGNTPFQHNIGELEWGRGGQCRLYVSPDGPGASPLPCILPSRWFGKPSR